MNAIPDVPSKTAPMREAIILAYAKLHDDIPEDAGHLSSNVQFTIMMLAGREEASSDYMFDDRSSTGKAFERAMEQLRAEGIVVVNPEDPNEIEFNLALYLVGDD